MKQKISDEQFFKDLRKKMDNMVEEQAEEQLKELKNIFGDEETIEVTAEDLVELHKDLSKNVSKQLADMAFLISKYVKSQNNIIINRPWIKERT